jgi:hypothetical protein
LRKYIIIVVILLNCYTAQAGWLDNWFNNDNNINEKLLECDKNPTPMGIIRCRDDVLHPYKSPQPKPDPTNPNSYVN